MTGVPTPTSTLAGLVPKELLEPGRQQGDNPHPEIEAADPEIDLREEASGYQGQSHCPQRTSLPSSQSSGSSSSLPDWTLSEWRCVGTGSASATTTDPARTPLKPARMHMAPGTSTTEHAGFLPLPDAGRVTCAEKATRKTSSAGTKRST